jgi:quercetin dioxygenase-like cupin family protein
MGICRWLSFSALPGKLKPANKRRRLMVQAAHKAEAAPARNAHGAGVTKTKEIEYTMTIAGESLSYPSTPNPVVLTNVLTIQPGVVTDWMVHPVQPFLYVLEGTLTVEFAADGSRHTFNAGQGFLQTRCHWHRGRNDGETAVRLLGIFIGAEDVPVMLHAPAGPAVQR